MARNSNKDIDFLSVYKTKKKINTNSKTLLLIALPVLLILIFATSTLYLTITNRNLQKDVDTLQTQIEEALAATASNTNSDQQKELSKLNEQLTNLQTITQTLSKYPQIDKGILETIDKSCKNLTIDSISFNQETGAISLTVTASKVNGCEETVRTLRESGTFKTVDYNGYTQDGGVSETTETVTDPTTGATTTQAVTNTKKLMIIAYISTIISAGILLVGVRYILRFYALPQDTANLAVSMVSLHCVFDFFVWPMAFSFPNALRAANDATFTMIVSTFSMWTFRFALSYVFALYLHMGVIGVWWAMIVDWIFRSICFMIRYKSNKWMNRTLV